MPRGITDLPLTADDARRAFRDTLRALPGYPWLPCPICKCTGSCDHIAAERAQAALPGLQFPDLTKPN